MMTMPAAAGLKGSAVADLVACGARVPGGKARWRRYSMTPKTTTQAIRAAPATEATMGHQRKPAAAAPLPPPGDVVVGEGRVEGTAAASRLLAREAACRINAPVRV